jgi:hypothetical protein
MSILEENPTESFSFSAPYLAGAPGDPKGKLTPFAGGDNSRHSKKKRHHWNSTQKKSRPEGRLLSGHAEA